MLYALMTTLETGETLDHYRLDAVVARGGMSTLFKATDLRDSRRVAIKVPHAEMEADPILVERFRREQEIGQELDHPGVVKTYEPEHRSRAYMVIEWVDGRLLRDLLNQERKLPVDRAVSLTLAICDALDCMHKHGVVHRDLKPENIMVDSEDRIKIIDFGIAMKEDARRITFVDMSATLGTPDYISPEQVKGKRGDGRSDIYAMGVILYEMLSGKLPFSGPNPMAAMNDRLLNYPMPPSVAAPSISAQLQEVLYRALEREPKNRYATAHEFAHDLEHLDEVGVEDRVELRDWQKRKSQLSRKIVYYTALALVPLAIFLLMYLVAHHGAHR